MRRFRIMRAERIRSRQAVLQAGHAAAIEALEGRTMLTTLTVITGVDNQGMAPVMGSLRYQITQANIANNGTASDPTMIVFSGLTGAVQLQGSLPPITASYVSIDGTTNINGSRVAIDGGGNHVVFDVKATGFSLRGVSIADANTAVCLDAGSSDAAITNNSIGSVGTSLNGNTNGVCLLNGTLGDTIGGADSSDQNLVSGNYIGIAIGNTSGPSVTGNLIEGNWVGLDASGNSSVQNSYGVDLLSTATENTVTDNVISGNTNDVWGAGDSGNIISSNYVGLDGPTKTQPVGDSNRGIALDEGYIGSLPAGGDTITNNIIQGSQDGMTLYGNRSSVSGNMVYNTTGDAIAIEGNFNALTSNSIHDNNGVGVRIEDEAEDNTLSQNAIFSNTGLGIEFDKDNDDSGAVVLNGIATGGLQAIGPNGYQPYPTLTVVNDPGNATASSANQLLDVNVSMTDAVSSQYDIELFADDVSHADASNYGPGQTYIPGSTLTTNQSGYGSVTIDISKSSFDGGWITATATNISPFSSQTNPDGGATSQFAQNVATPDILLPKLRVSDGFAHVGGAVVFTPTLSATLQSAVTVHFNLSAGTATTADYTDTSGTLTIQPGELSNTISVEVPGDATNTNETFTLNLYGLSNDAVFDNGQSTETATGTIIPTPTGTSPSTITVGSSADSIAVGDAVTLTAKVIGYSGTPGFVTFLENGTGIGTAQADSNGAATLTTTDLASGTDSITATYSGDNVYAASSSASISVQIGPPVGVSTPTSITLKTSAASVTVGTTFALTATVTSATGLGTTPSGVVDFFLAGVLLQSAPLGQDGQAEVTVPATAVASGNMLTASYEGDANYSQSDSNAVSVNFVAASTAVPVIPKSTVPANAIAGKKYVSHFLVTTTNSGDLLKGTFNISLYADDSNTGLDGNQVFITSLVRQYTLKDGHSFSVSLSTTTLPLALGDGTFYFLVEIQDPDGMNSLTATTKSVTVAPPTVTLAVSLTPLKVDSFGSRPSQIIYMLTVTDTGNVDAVGALSLSASPFNSTNSVGVVQPATGSVRSVRIATGKSKKYVVRTKYIGAGTIPVGVYSVELTATVNTISTTAEIDDVFSVTN